MTTERNESGGAAARRAVLRWSLRMVAREWRQQVIICLLVAIAVATTILAAGVISGSQVPQNAGFGSANAMAQLQGQDPHLTAELAALRAHFGDVDVINSVPVSTGLVQGALLQSFNPHGALVAPLVTLVSGRFPTGSDEVDLSSELAHQYSVGVGGTWVAVGRHWRVVGEIENPTDLNKSSHRSGQCGSESIV